MAKYYAVRVGARTGVFTSWEECQKAVDGFSGAKFKKFHSLEEAEKFVYEDNDSKPIKEDLVDGYINAYVDMLMVATTRLRVVTLELRLSCLEIMILLS